MSLEGRVAIVTGGGRGIGRGICLCLAEDGADIVIPDLDMENAEKTVSDIRAMGRKALAIKINVTKPDEVAAMVETVLAQFGKIDILVNNAGVLGAPGCDEGKPARLSDWDACYEVNLKAQVICSEAVAPHMKERHSGNIVNIASVAGRGPRDTIPHYAASKAACINWTQSLALMLAPYDIRVNAICPGVIWTPIWQELGDRIRNMNPALADKNAREVTLTLAKRRAPLQREQTPEDIGYAICFFVSDRAKNITGQTLNVDGGAVMS